MKLLSEEQLENVYDSINVKDDNISTFSKDVQLLKTEKPIFVTDDWITISFILEHPENASDSINFIDDGIFISVNDEQL